MPDSATTRRNPGRQRVPLRRVAVYVLIFWLLLMFALAGVREATTSQAASRERELILAQTTLERIVEADVKRSAIAIASCIARRFVAWSTKPKSSSITKAICFAHV